VIGVIAEPGQETVVGEFFELFKTPWEFYVRGRTYDVVIATADAVPDPMPSFFLDYGGVRKKTDAAAADIVRHEAATVHDGEPLPLYTSVLTFGNANPATARLAADVGIVAVGSTRDGRTTIRIGYDVFEEVRFLLSRGQAADRAHVPAVDLHIAMLRRWILEAGIPVLEIMPSPVGHPFAVCLTHDIDFVGIRRHLLDHTMLGFLYRSTSGALRGAISGRLPLRRMWQAWRAALSLPFVYAGWMRDFWEPFGWYLDAEKGVPATYFLIPFKRRPGDGADRRRATQYDVTDIQDSAKTLIASGCEIGVHGIDAWHDVAKGAAELARVAGAVGERVDGVRMHWLMRDVKTCECLERAGFAYDSTGGYNETVGYLNGTVQVFRPLSACTLLELPMHIQDGALFYPNRLHLSDAEALDRCQELIDRANTFGGVLTVLWHDRSHAAERFWGDFYLRLLGTLKRARPWFATASDVVAWFRKRRAVRFERVDGADGARVRLRYEGEPIDPPLRVVLHEPEREGGPPLAWRGDTAVEFDLHTRPVLSPAL